MRGLHSTQEGRIVALTDKSMERAILEQNAENLRDELLRTRESTKPDTRSTA